MKSKKIPPTQHEIINAEEAATIALGTCFLAELERDTDIDEWIDEDEEPEKPCQHP